MQTVVQLTIRLSDLSKVIELVKAAPIKGFEDAKERLRLVEVLNNNISNTYHISNAVQSSSDLSQQEK